MASTLFNHQIIGGNIVPGEPVRVGCQFKFVGPSLHEWGMPSTLKVPLDPKHDVVGEEAPVHTNTNLEERQNLSLDSIILRHTLVVSRAKL